MAAAFGPVAAPTMIEPQLAPLGLQPAAATTAATAVSASSYWGTALGLVVLYLVMKHVVNPILRRRAWEVCVISDPHHQVHPGVHTPGWALWGETPGYDARGIYMLFTHSPAYVFKTLHALALFPVLMLQWCFTKDLLNKISDAVIYDYVTNSSLVILTKFEGDNYVLHITANMTPINFHLIGNCDPRTLRLVFNKDKQIIEASSKNGPITSGNKWVGRNEILVNVLLNIDSIWLHPTIHIGSEKSALEIQAKRISELEPSAHIVSSLHEGLMHGPLSPLNRASPLYSGSSSQQLVFENIFSKQFPVHNLDERKMDFELYEFVMEGRKEVFRLVREHKLDVDAEYLFMNIIMHSIDHEMVYENLSKLPVCSSDGTGSFYSYWETHCYTFIWLGHLDNPAASDRITANLDKPFYRDLHAAMSKVNKLRADHLYVSCCF